MMSADEPTKAVPYSGLKSGRYYELWMQLGGWTPEFYRRAAAAIPLEPGNRVLELGCGTASLGLAMDPHIQPGGELHGVDLSPEQLRRARVRVRGSDVPFLFHETSMDQLPFPPSSFDVVVSCLALCQACGTVRRRAIQQAATLPKPHGQLALIEPGRPRFGYQSIFMAPFFTMIPDWRDHWYNRLARYCEEAGLTRHTDRYLTSFARFQVFNRTPIQSGMP